MMSYVYNQKENNQQVFYESDYNSRNHSVVSHKVNYNFMRKDKIKKFKTKIYRRHIKM